MNNMPNITADNVLTGHTSPETAFVVDDYPYGLRLRCKIRYWIETVPKKGDRFCSQTTNPKVAGDPWNKPRKSTYSPVGVMYLDEQGHVQWTAVSVYSDMEWVNQFAEATAGKLTESQQKLLDAIVKYRTAYEAKRAAEAASA